MRAYGKEHAFEYRKKTIKIYRERKGEKGERRRTMNSRRNPARTNMQEEEQGLFEMRVENLRNPNFSFSHIRLILLLNLPRI